MPQRLRRRPTGAADGRSGGGAQIGLSGQPIAHRVRAAGQVPVVGRNRDVLVCGLAAGGGRARLVAGTNRGLPRGTSSPPPGSRCRREEAGPVSAVRRRVGRDRVVPARLGDQRVARGERLWRRRALKLGEHEAGRMARVGPDLVDRRGLQRVEALLARRARRVDPDPAFPDLVYNQAACLQRLGELDAAVRATSATWRSRRGPRTRQRCARSSSISGSGREAPHHRHRRRRAPRGREQAVC